MLLDRCSIAVSGASDQYNVEGEAEGEEEGEPLDLEAMEAMSAGSFVHHLVLRGQTWGSNESALSVQRTVEDVAHCSEVLESHVTGLEVQHTPSLAAVAASVTTALNRSSCSSTFPALRDPLSRLLLVLQQTMEFLDAMSAGPESNIPLRAEAIRSHHTLEHTQSTFRPKAQQYKSRPTAVQKQADENMPTAMVTVHPSVHTYFSSSTESVAVKVKLEVTAVQKQADKNKPTAMVTVYTSVHTYFSSSTESVAVKVKFEVRSNVNDDDCPVCLRPISKKAAKGHCMGRCQSKSDGGGLGNCLVCLRPLSKKAAKGHCMGKCQSKSDGGGLGNCLVCQLPISKKRKEGHCTNRGMCSSSHSLTSLPAGLPPLIFFGGPGTGKTYQLQRLHSVLHSCLPQGTCAMVAVFGVVAQRISGQTLASVMGIGRGEGSEDDWVDRVEKNPRARLRILQLQALCIDDWSPAGAHDFHKYEALARRIRKKEEFFGGIFVSATVDFLQILSLDQPPLWTAKVWHEAVVLSGTLVHLQEQHRFANLEDGHLLDRVRTNKLGNADEQASADISRLTNLSANDVEALEPLNIFPLKDEVEAFHSAAAAKMLEEEPSRILRYRPLVTKGGTADPSAPAAREQRFIIGQRIMFKVNNLDGQRNWSSFNRQPVYANGTFGKVVAAQQLVGVPGRRHLLSAWLQYQGTFEVPVVILEDDPSTRFILEPILFDVQADGSQVIAARSLLDRCSI